MALRKPLAPHPADWTHEPHCRSFTSRMSGMISTRGVQLGGKSILLALNQAQPEVINLPSLLSEPGAQGA